MPTQRIRKTAASTILCHHGQMILVVLLGMWMGTAVVYADIPQQNSAKSWHLATTDTELEWAVKDGAPVLEVLRSVAMRRNWLAAPLKESLMKSVQVDGVSNSRAKGWD